MAARRNTLCRVIARKPSGLTLIQLACGCSEWSKRRDDGTIRYGRRASWCGRPGLDGEGTAACVARDLDAVGVRFVRAAEFVHSDAGRAALSNANAEPSR